MSYTGNDVLVMGQDLYEAEQCIHVAMTSLSQSIDLYNKISANITLLELFPSTGPAWQQWPPMYQKYCENFILNMPQPPALIGG